MIRKGLVMMNMMNQKRIMCTVFVAFSFLFVSIVPLRARGIYNDALPDAMNSLLFLKKLRQTPSVLHHQCAIKRNLNETLKKQDKFCLVGNNQLFAFFPNVIGVENVRKNVIEDMTDHGFSIREDECIVWAEHSSEQLAALLEDINQDLGQQPACSNCFIQTIYEGNGQIRKHVISLD